MFRHVWDRIHCVTDPLCLHGTGLKLERYGSNPRPDSRSDPHRVHYGPGGYSIAKNTGAGSIVWGLGFWLGKYILVVFKKIDVDNSSGAAKNYSYG